MTHHLPSLFQSRIPRLHLDCQRGKLTGFCASLRELMNTNLLPYSSHMRGEVDTSYILWRIFVGFKIIRKQHFFAFKLTKA